jgi:DNA helicase-2/ATP-dependent DNA helicase PcrA
MSSPQSANNRVVLACAGARKTTGLVDDVLAHPERRTLVTTYTLENLDQLRECFLRRSGCVPQHVTLMSWFSFLLAHCARPYQPALFRSPRLVSYYFDPVPNGLRFVAKGKNPRAFFTTSSGYLYRDRAAEFGCAVDDATGGAVVRRLELIYDAIVIDEFQDMAHYDLDLLDKLLASKIAVTAVGDPRQATFSTSLGAKNRQFRGPDIVKWLSHKARAPLLDLETRTESFRCNQAICDFADQLWPTLPKTTSMNVPVTAHDGIFRIERKEVAAYVAEHSPTVLRYHKATETMDLPAINFGMSKGRTYDRVLIFPTAKMRKYLDTKNPADAGDISKFYVAVTRARYSVAFVVD